MCGIFGALSFNKPFNNTDEKKFVTATDLIAYRGPDSYGYYKCNPYSSHDDSCHLFLSHRRLSIIDLSPQGHQPLIIDDFVIVFNGEIFNYLELRDELIKLGYQFKTNTDTEVIIKLYQHFGSKGFGKMNGMWAFILYDKQSKKVIISRDRFSIKPLYYLQYNDVFYWASELKQLLPFVKSKSINKKILFNFFQQNLLDHSHETFFADIKHAKPMFSTIIDLQNKQIGEEQYWNYTLSSPSNNFDNAFEQFHQLLTDSINIRLRSDVKIGSLLSGGLDSSAISIIANQLTPQGIHTFSVVSDNKTVSEEKFIDIVVNQRNIWNRKLKLQPEMIPQYIDKVLFHQDEPFGSFSVIAQHLIFKKIKDETDITVLLSGQGGDEVMLGYLKFYFYHLQQSLKKGQLVEVAAQLFGALYHQTVLKQFSLHEAKRYLPSLSAKTNNYFRITGELVDSWNFQNLQQRQISDINHFSVPALTHYEDRNSMAYSLEIRHPFLDHQLVDFLIQLPTSLKIRNGWTKYILRKSITELPKEIAWRKDKLGFTVPDELWLKNDLQKLIFNSFENSILDEMGIISKTEFLNYYKQFLNGNKKTFHQEVFKVLIAELWAKKNFN